MSQQSYQRSDFSCTFRNLPFSIRRWNSFTLTFNLGKSLLLSQQIESRKATLPDLQGYYKMPYGFRITFSLSWGDHTWHPLTLWQGSSSSIEWARVGIGLNQQPTTTNRHISEQPSTLASIPVHLMQFRAEII